MRYRPYSARNPQPVDATPSINWAVLNLDPAWIDMWTSPHSFVVQEIERLERDLHDPTITDPERTQGLKHRLAALQWLREGVALAAAGRRVDGMTEDDDDSTQRKGWRALLSIRRRRPRQVNRDAVLPRVM